MSDAERQKKVERLRQLQQAYQAALANALRIEGMILQVQEDLAEEPDAPADALETLERPVGD